MKKRIILFFLISISLHPFNQRYVSNVLKKINANQSLIASGVDFRGAQSLLQGKKFVGELSGANFSKNDTAIVPLTGTVKIPGQATNLSGSTFFQTNLVSASFKGANLTNAIFNGADIGWADFSEANLKNAQFLNVKNMPEARFYKAIMPDGTILLNGSWADNKGNVFYAHAPKK